jgi:transcriptional regulator GlxA family with amidase domain
MHSEFSNPTVLTTIKRSSTAHSIHDAQVESAQLNASRPLDRRIQVVVMLIESNSHKHIAIEEMARSVNLSPGRLAHLFKSEMQLSLKQYLTQLRLAKAKGHLESSFLSVKEISASVGFSSVTRFVVCFKSFVGATPAHYRKHFLNSSYRDAQILP